MTWTLEKLKKGLEEFYAIHKRYPTSQEVDTFTLLPSARQIQRRFGGLVELRKQLGLSGPHDFTKGEHSSKRALKINQRAHKIEQEVYDYLKNRFGKEFVHREYFFTDDRRTRTDFFIHYKDGKFSVDIFYPENRHSFIGCLNSKMKTYNTDTTKRYPVIFLMMNKALDGEIGHILKYKKNKLQNNQQVLGFNELKMYCNKKISKKAV